MCSSQLFLEGHFVFFFGGGGGVTIFFTLYFFILIYRVLLNSVEVL